MSPLLPPFVLPPAPCCILPLSRNHVLRPLSQRQHHWRWGITGAALLHYDCAGGGTMDRSNGDGSSNSGNNDRDNGRGIRTSQGGVSGGMQQGAGGGAKGRSNSNSSGNGGGDSFRTNTLPIEISMSQIFGSNTAQML
ncbi:hypothetical protein B0H14DRAFT_2582940 [Mycena olivaceomarginata]|nr:hypothetical protein B0H14DRAFT_2582940 [Mycena olivaceomarginata]